MFVSPFRVIVNVSSNALEFRLALDSNRHSHRALRVFSQAPHLTAKNARPRSGEILVSASRRMRVGSRSPARANSDSARGMVAENSSVCRDAGMPLRMARSCSAKPISNSLRTAWQSGSPTVCTSRRQRAPCIWKSLAFQYPAVLCKRCHGAAVRLLETDVSLPQQAAAEADHVHAHSQWSALRINHRMPLCAQNAWCR